MRLDGYLPLSERGFALPVYRRSDRRSNALYRAIPEVEGDHLAAIANFEAMDAPPTTEIDESRPAVVGTPWLDVFLWDERPVVGTVAEIFAAMADRHDEIGSEAPLTFLDLALAAGSPDTPRSAAAAREFLRRTLGRTSGERSFREVVVRPGVSLEIRRCLHRFGDPVGFGMGADFDAVPVREESFHVALDGETLRRVGAVSAFEELRAAVARFGDALGLGIEVLEPPMSSKDERPPEPAPPQQPPAPAFGPRPARAPRSRLLGLVEELAVDLGTNNTRLHARGRGVVLAQPSVIAVEARNGIRKVIAVGDAAREALDRAPGGVEVIRPLRDGAIVDLEACVAMLGEFLRRVRPRRLFRRPLDVIVCLPAGSTSLERRAMRDAAGKAGASKVWLVEAPLAAAIGAGLPLHEPIGSMIVQVGGGTTEIAILALRGLAYTTSMRIGGDRMDEAVINHMRRHHNLLIGPRSAERLKREIGAGAQPADGVGRSATVRGRDLVNGVPKEIEITTAEIASAIAEPVAQIVEGVRIVLENTAPELAADIVDTGIVLVGGGAQLHGLDAVIRQETGLAVTVADDPADCVTRGLARILDDAAYRSLLLP